LLCRLTPSLCLNFLGLAHLDSHISRTTLSVPETISNSINSVIAGGEQNTHSESSSSSPSSNPSLTVPRVSYTDLETTYTRFMGHLDVIPFIASGFNVYFPILVVLLCVLTYVRFGDRVLHHLGVPQLLDNWIETDQVAAADSPNSLVEDAIQDGRLLLRKERMMLSRNERLTPVDDSFRFSSTGSRKSYRSRPEDRVHLLESALDHSEGRFSPAFKSGTAVVRPDEELDDEDETDLLPPLSAHVDPLRTSRNPIGSAGLVEYSEAEIEKQFSLGRH
uniref:RSN1_TM domain-containing protein n=1 Tax=Echinostoma caproni TaxID=27848 RepID=A0A183B3E4_9TREM